MALYTVCTPHTGIQSHNLDDAMQTAIQYV